MSDRSYLEFASPDTVPQEVIDVLESDEFELVKEGPKYWVAEESIIGTAFELAVRLREFAGLTFAVRQHPKYENPGLLFVADGSEFVAFNMDGQCEPYLSPDGVFDAVASDGVESLLSVLKLAVRAGSWFTDKESV